MNSMKYQNILNLNLAAPARKLKLGHIFQQDNDPKHTWCEEESAQERTEDSGWSGEIL